MNEEQLLAFLKENLSISVNTVEYQNYGEEGVKVEVALYLDGKLITEDYNTFSTKGF